MYLYVNILYLIMTMFPGLPTNRRDMFLCIITKLKSQPQPPHDIPRKRKHSGKVHFSSDTPPSDTPKKKKSRPQVSINKLITIKEILCFFISLAVSLIAKVLS